MVPIQLKNFTPVGTAMSIVITAKNGRSTWTVAYMWWAQTVTDRAAIAIVALLLARKMVESAQSGRAIAGRDLEAVLA